MNKFEFIKHINEGENSDNGMEMVIVAYSASHDDSSIEVSYNTDKDMTASLLLIALAKVCAEMLPGIDQFRFVEKFIIATSEVMAEAHEGKTKDI